jgi:hypothetical protein
MRSLLIAVTLAIIGLAASRPLVAGPGPLLPASIPGRAVDGDKEGGGQGEYQFGEG